jgi:hypothetical protein
MKKKVRMMISVIAVKPLLQLIQSHQNILKMMIEFMFLKENMDQVDHSKAKGISYWQWYLELCAVLHISPILRINHLHKILISNLFRYSILLCSLS